MHDDKLVIIKFNRRTNSYLAVTGKPGSGKTQFVKDLLAQIRLQSDFAVDFVFFHYAKGDVANDAEFVEMTRAEVVRLPEQSLPVNPFARVNVNSEMAVKIAAQEFSDLIRSIERLGTVQAQRLYDAIAAGFDVMRGANPPFPDFDLIKQEIDTRYFILNNYKPDTLTEIVRQLTEFQIFARHDDAGSLISPNCSNSFFCCNQTRARSNFCKTLSASRRNGLKRCRAKLRI